MNNKQTVFLASYPKSGNTWYRTFLKALEDKENLDINNLGLKGGIYSSKSYIKKLGVLIDYLPQELIEKYQRIGFEDSTSKQKETSFVKIHDAYTYNVHKTPLISDKHVRCAICLVRNPLDVTLSLANHVNLSIQDTIDKYMANPEGCFVKKGPSRNNQFHQPLGTWSMHVESWLRQTKIPVHFMRYEDMKSDTFNQFKTSLAFAKIAYTDNEINKAIDLTQFDKLKRQEQEKGFKEKSKNSKSFFNKGLVGRWKKELTEEQVHTIVKHNEPMMHEFNYEIPL